MKKKIFAIFVVILISVLFSCTIIEDTPEWCCLYRYNNGSSPLEIWCPGDVEPDWDEVTILKEYVGCTDYDCARSR